MLTFSLCSVLALAYIPLLTIRRIREVDEIGIGVGVGNCGRRRARWHQNVDKCFVFNDET